MTHVGRRSVEMFLIVPVPVKEHAVNADAASWLYITQCSPLI